MITTITWEEARASLPDLLNKVIAGEEVVITRDARPVARLTPVSKPQPQFGSCRGMMTIVAEDDEHLQDFAEYMP